MYRVWRQRFGAMSFTARIFMYIMLTRTCTSSQMQHTLDYIIHYYYYCICKEEEELDEEVTSWDYINYILLCRFSHSLYYHTHIIMAGANAVRFALYVYVFGLVMLYSFIDLHIFLNTMNCVVGTWVKINWTFSWISI